MRPERWEALRNTPTWRPDFRDLALEVEPDDVAEMLELIADAPWAAAAVARSVLWYRREAGWSDEGQVSAALLRRLHRLGERWREGRTEQILNQMFEEVISENPGPAFEMKELVEVLGEPNAKAALVGEPGSTGYWYAAGGTEIYLQCDESGRLCAWSLA